jgi:hypothetical protein
VHLDGYDLGSALRGEAAWPRKEFIYWTDDGSVAALRYGDLKVALLEQPGHGLRVWQDPFKVLRAPLLTNVRMEPAAAETGQLQPGARDGDGDGQLEAIRAVNAGAQLGLNASSGHEAISRANQVPCPAIQPALVAIAAATASQVASKASGVKLAPEGSQSAVRPPASV